MEYEITRSRMVDENLIPRGISDERVLQAMKIVPRHLFVDEGLRNQAYGDHPLPIGRSQTISQPYMVALMTELLRLSPDDRVLEIGTGSGYQSAVLSRVVKQVYSIERIPDLARRAKENLEKAGIHNVSVMVFDGTYGFSDRAPYQGIMVTAGTPEIPAPLLEQLADGGRLVLPLGGEGGQTLMRVTRVGEEFQEERFGGCVFVKLVGKYGWKESGSH